MNQTFEIEWSLDDSGWGILDEFDSENDPGREFDTGGVAIFLSTAGRFQMRYGDQDLFLEDMSIAPLWVECVSGHWVAPATQRTCVWGPRQFGLLSIAATRANGVDTDWFRNAPPIVFDVFLSDGDPETYVQFTKLPWSDNVSVRYRVRNLTLPPPETDSSLDEFWPDLEMDDVASYPLVVPEDEFLLGVRRFLHELSTEIFERNPKLREWQSFELFLKYEEQR